VKFTEFNVTVTSPEKKIVPWPAHELLYSDFADKIVVEPMSYHTSSPSSAAKPPECVQEQPIEQQPRISSGPENQSAPPLASLNSDPEAVLHPINVVVEIDEAEVAVE
jgi:hypothetical protein